MVKSSELVKKTYNLLFVVGKVDDLFYKKLQKINKKTLSVKRLINNLIKWLQIVLYNGFYFTIDIQ